MDGLELSRVHSNHSGNDRCVSQRARGTEIFIELCNAMQCKHAKLANALVFSFFLSLSLLFVRVMLVPICLNLSLSIGTTNALNCMLRFSQLNEMSGEAYNDDVAEHKIAINLRA